MNTRRDFLAAAGASALLLSGSQLFPQEALAQAASRLGSVSADASEYGFEPGLIYLNTGSAGPTPRAVLDRTLDAWVELEKNPVVNEYSLLGLLGRVENVREQAATFLGCSKDELLITRSTSEGMNTVAQSIRLNAGDRVVLTDQEHAGGSDCWRYMAERRGVILDEVKIPPDEDDPHAIVQRFAQAIKPETRVISVSHIFYTTGMRMPVQVIAALARSRKLLCVVDGAQACGATPVDVKALGCHAYATTGHKWLMGPKGVSMLYISSEAQEEIKPIQWTTGSKQYVDNSVGVGPLPLVMGLGAALEIAEGRGVAKIEEHNIRLRKRAYEGLSQISGMRMMSLESGPLTSAIVSVALPEKFDSHDMLIKLRLKHHLMVREIEKLHFNGLRIAPHFFNTESEVDAAVEALREEMA